MGILRPPYNGFDAAIHIGQERLCLPYAGFLIDDVTNKFMIILSGAGQPVIILFILSLSSDQRLNNYIILTNFD